MRLPVDRLRPRQGGLTLIEVLVALAIVAITLTAGIKAAGGLTVNAQRMRDLTMAQWCAENHLLSLRMTKTFPPVAESDFSCQQLGRTFPGHMIVKSNQNVNFREVRIQMMDEDQQPVLSLSTLLPRY